VDFALILFVLSIVTGILWCYDVFKARKVRGAAFQAALTAALEARRSGDIGKAEALLTEQGISLAEARAVLSNEEATATAARKALQVPNPWWVEYCASFFPVILPIFLLRSFWLEPFRIPSASMVPTLLVGDFILVNKYAYGIRLPVINKKVIEIGQPQRGDVMVFRYPLDPSQDYIKRVIGLPGDRVEYINKRLTINGKPMPVTADGEFVLQQSFSVMSKFQEDLNGRKHAILNDANGRADVPPEMIAPHAYRDSCHYTDNGVTCMVPPGHYFMMGDNRDQSADSRMWGFVPDENIVGKAFFVWFHADRILPIPGGVNFDRIGGFK